MAHSTRLAAGTSAMKYKRTEIEQVNKKQEIKKWLTIRMSKNGGHHSKKNSISFLAFAKVQHHVSKLILLETNETRCKPRMLKIKEPADCKSKN